MLKFKCGLYFGTSEVLNLPQHIDSVTILVLSCTTLLPIL